MASGITVDFTAETGVIRPLHGVNNGPKTTGFYRDASALFREAGIPLCRLHDTEYPFGSGAFVDIPCIFKDFDADADDPESYDFSQTDAYIQAILDVGAKPLYRLGVSIEHTPVKRNIYAPKDAKKWAAICEHIVRHYNEGWKDGMKAGIEYWEIWNEPESASMWIGTRDQFFELYEVTAKHLKACFPSIKVGGYGSCGFYALTDIPVCAVDLSPGHRKWQSFVDWAEAFCKLCAKRSIPLDFYSWHLYSSAPENFRIHARYVRELLDRNGLTATESILDEWNLAGEDMFDRMTTSEGAAHGIAVLCRMQENAVDAATYYDSQPTLPYCGIFKLTSLKPTKQFYALKYWNTLYRMGTRVKTTAEGDALYAAAACDGARRAMVVSNYDAADKNLRIEIKNLAENAAYRVYATDPAHENALTQSGTLWKEYPYIDIVTVRYTALFIEIDPPKKV
ncbi:MAG: hypothetical protein VB111_05625 [Clostridiaceae bacterium]|nr:hypothetical protein [Clostridiaceae bacterium]